MTTPTPRPPSRDADDRPGRPRRDFRRALGVALGVSAALHLAAILLYPVFFAPNIREGRMPAPVAGGEERPEGTELIRIAEVPEDEVRDPEEPDSRTVPVPRAPVAAEIPGEGAPGAGEIEPPGPRLNAAERIRATAPDTRLVEPLPDEVVALSPEQIAQLQLVWALEELNDSAAAAAEAARRATDWTFTDSDGKRWGLSPEGLHLGDVTLPIPSFGAPYDPNAWKGSIEADLARAAGSAAARESGDDRAEAIRERRDRERREKADTTTSGGGGGGG